MKVFRFVYILIDNIFYPKPPNQISNGCLPGVNVIKLFS